MKRLIISIALIASLAGNLAAFADPAWTPLKPLQSVRDLGPVLTDIEAHLPAGHPYRDSDRITWTHEGTHGVNSRIRQELGTGFYVLCDRAVLLKEPSGTLAAVAASVPKSLRGDVYTLYLVQGQQWWNGQPSYVFDEWVAYTNGTAARLELKIADRAETCRYAQEFIVYALCVAQTAKSNDPQMKEFIRWQIERVHTLIKASSLPVSNQLKDAPDAESLREFSREYLGQTWCKKNLGF
jgi:hypothetical protein